MSTPEERIQRVLDDPGKYRLVLADIAEVLDELKAARAAHDIQARIVGRIRNIIYAPTSQKDRIKAVQIELERDT